MSMTEAAAREIVILWKKHHYPNRPKTNQVLLAEEILRNAPAPRFTDVDFLKEMSTKQTELIRQINRSEHLNQSEKMYLVSLHKDIKSFYDRYIQRLKRKK
jgi:hypothetical protein